MAILRSVAAPLCHEIDKVRGVLAAFDLEPESAAYGAEIRRHLAVSVEHLDPPRQAGASFSR